MPPLRLDQLLDLIARTDLVVMLLWGGCGLLSLTLLVLAGTRWGYHRTLRKCVILSLLAHFLLAGYATTVRIVTSQPSDEQDEASVRILLNEPEPDTPENVVESEQAVEQEKPAWDRLAHDTEIEPETPEVARVEPESQPEPERQSHSPDVPLPGAPRLDRMPLPLDTPQPEPSELVDPNRPAAPVIAEAAPPIDVPAAERRELVFHDTPFPLATIRRPPVSDPSPKPLARSIPVGTHSDLEFVPMAVPRMTEAPTTPDPIDAVVALAPDAMRATRGGPAQTWTPRHDPAKTARSVDNEPSVGDLTRDGLARVRPPSVTHQRTTAGDGPGPRREFPDQLVAIRPAMPTRRQSDPWASTSDPYRQRTAPDRSVQAKIRGATTESEEAVEWALRWLASVQSADGRFDAARFGAGREGNVDRHDRKRAGIKSDTGMTGLALMAFLASGSTHKTGAYRESVRRGLNFLITKQKSDGRLDGDATPYAAHYCHAMATIAMCEAYAMTGESKLRDPARRAVAYTLMAQDPESGGWRYDTKGDPGDTSQFGWQLMVLKSAEAAKIPIPAKARAGMRRFLRSVAAGTHGGLATYRPGVPEPSRPMTAEALACRLFLGASPNDPAQREAADYLLEEIPGEGEPNFYYWYYGTLAMYQYQGAHWKAWNEGLRGALLDKQRKSGPLEGSWDTDTAWGGNGGRIYTTAMATLSLQVYYRFLPTFVEPN